MSGFVPEKPTRGRIIVAEDDPATLALLERQLRNANYDVTACRDGRSAFEAIRDAGAGMLIADWGMPEMDGLELCRAVRELQAMRVLQPVHFILLTANSDTQHIVEGLEAGADDYLTKPYRVAELLARIRVGERTLTLVRELMGQQLEVQKANAMLQVFNEKLEKLANTDTLTGLYNRRVLFERFGQAWAQAARGDAALSCIMLDIDHFKRCNDTYGHAAGDAVLVEVARRIRTHVRPYDVCARFGGEEFVIICPGADLPTACEIGERVRTAVEGAPVRTGGETIQPTISVGVATRDAAFANPDALIAAADGMLYAAKENGRNQVWWRDHEGQPQPLTALRASS